MMKESAPQISSLVAGRIGLGAFWQSSILPPCSSLSMHSLENLLTLTVVGVVCSPPDVWAKAGAADTPSAPSPMATASSALLVRMCFLLTGDDEGEDEPEQGQGLGEGDAEEHRRTGHASRLGLAGHGGDGVADDDADADARPDGGAAIDDASAHGGQPGDELTGVLGS